MSIMTVQLKKNEMILVDEDGTPHSYNQTHPMWARASKLVLEGSYDEALALLKDGIEDTILKAGLRVENEKIWDKDRELPASLSQRIISVMRARGNLGPILNFWANLRKNPSYRSVETIWSFLENKGIPIDDEGRILAYKGLRSDFTDRWTGTFKNVPGAEMVMDRNRVSDDPNVACHFGFHAGSKTYAQDYACGGPVVIVAINPEDVVCVPYDCGCQKLRSCRYKVIGRDSGEILDDTIVDEHDLPEVVGLAAQTPDNNGRATLLEDEELDEEEMDEYDDDEDELDEDEELERDLDEEEDLKPDTNPKSTVPKKRLAEQWSYMDQMGAKELMNETMDNLRRYVTNCLQVVGVSKMRGGKETLILNILKWRLELKSS